MRNEKPCSVCRILRKRCIWTENSDVCTRCAQNGSECIPIDVYQGSDSGEPVAQDGEQELKEWEDDVSKLQDAIEEMESALAKSVIPTITSSSSSSLPPSTIYPSFSGQIKPALTLSYSRSTSSSSSSSIISSSIGGTSTSSITSIDDSGDENSVGGYDDNNSSAANKLNQIEPVWQLTIVDGHIRLDSAIQTLDELEMYTRASLRYLSPFKAIFSTEQIYFDSPSISIPLASISFMQRSIIKKPRKKFLTIGYDDSTTYDYRAIADKELIPLYLEKYNVMTGFLHAPTFLKHYHELDDPLDDPLVLAVCVDAVAALRHNLHYTPVEKRHLADYFYTKCKNMLLDMFDDPTLKFESVTITTFLQMFLMDMVIDFAEARRLVTIALLICSELDVAYAKDEMNPVERVLYQRHRLTLAMFNRTIDVVLEDRIDLTASATIKLNTLDDEPETLKQYVAVSNHILEFVGTPFVANVLKRINRLIYGQSCSLRLDDILHFEPLAREWFDGLPPEFRICKDPFAPNVHTLIENNTSVTNFLPFSTLHMITAFVTSSVLQPRFSPSSTLSGSNSVVTMDVMQLIRNKASSLAITSCKVLLCVMRVNLEQDLILPSISFEAMSHSLYVLDKLASCAQIKFPMELRSLLQECYQTIRKRLPEDHQVPLSSTRLESFLKDQKDCPLDVYGQYPLPGYALLLDVYLTSIANLDRQLHQNQSNKKRDE